MGCIALAYQAKMETSLNTQTQRGILILLPLTLDREVASKTYPFGWGQRNCSVPMMLRLGHWGRKVATTFTTCPVLSVQRCCGDRYG